MRSAILFALLAISAPAYGRCGGVNGYCHYRYAPAISEANPEPNAIYSKETYDNLVQENYDNKERANKNWNYAFAFAMLATFGFVLAITVALINRVNR